ncbi:MAG: tyrosine-type recombinase/integrase [Syntrophomonadaceae bacterium]|nr:tyrosine-type recombinase/integrase [Syntrophomonadaceae bacterium]MDD4550017.1 tyrosine-type recombinase/integrase [Syntrophomonadaceae bacterium]
MADYAFNSLIGPFIEDFIRLKQALGYPYNSSTRILHHFDIFVADKFPEETTITKEMCTAWIHLKSGEHPNGLLRRVTPVRQLGKYMNGIGHAAYVIPGHVPDKQVKYEAHIYTDAELKAFFKSVDQCPASPFSPTRKYVIPVIFRILYCCGLRSSEARLLKKEDVDLQTGKITIRESKGWKARIVVTSDDLLEVCREYDSIMESMFPGRQVFFPNKDGNCFSQSILDRWFHEFWDRLPESRTVTGNPARVHDFRHGYAVHRLNQWVREGRDINALYPYISEYMGHSSYAATEYYLSLVEEFYPEMEQRLSSINDDILPEVHYEEE